MLGRNSGYVTTQGEFLTDLLRESGYDVVSTSVHPGRLRRLADIVTTLRRELDRVDLLIVETYSGPSYVLEDIASFLGVRAGKPVILHVHGGGMPAFARRYPRWTTRVLSRAAELVAPSAFLARELKPYAGEITIIPNIVELDGYPYRLRDRVAPKLLWMRAFHEIYNPLMAVRVLARVREVLPDATLVMAGQAKGMTDAVVAEAAALQLGDAFSLVGFLDERDKRAMAVQSDIFISTTHVDNAPVSVVEMCAMGLPVVSTAVGGVPDLLVNEETGLLVPDGDERAMAEAIIRLVREPALAARLSRNGPSVAASCVWPAILPKWESAFERTLARSPAAG
jgi:glycosyltransferase involved in cell wall biosynthesis